MRTTQRRQNAIHRRVMSLSLASSGRGTNLNTTRFSRRTLALMVLAFAACAQAQDRPAAGDLERTYQESIRPLIQRYCHECHADDVTEAEIDFGEFASLASARQDPRVWQKVRTMLDSQQMPPQDALQPDEPETIQLRAWVRAFLRSVAEATAGDPGPVVLRRLSNSEYNYTVRDLTGVDSLDPTREFPVDNAAGEGFTNTGSGQAMSTSLAAKYFNAANRVAEHAAFYPDGIRFTPYTSRRDLTDDALEAIRAYYARYTTEAIETAINLQGVRFDAKEGGVVPLDQYLTATVVEREALQTGATTFEAVAEEQGLSSKYLEILWRALNDVDSPSVLLDPIRLRWRKSKPEDVPQLVAVIGKWQRQLWKFNPVGHIGREGAPTSWMEPVSRLAPRQEFHIKLPTPDAGQDVVVYLSARGLATDGEPDHAVWSEMRLEGEAWPPVMLRHARGLHARQAEWNRELLASTSAYLAAASAAHEGVDVSTLAAQHEIRPTLLRVWLKYLNLPGNGPVPVSGHFSESLVRQSGYDFINGWGTAATPLVLSNASDQQVRIPGTAKPHSLVAHPSPTLFAAVGWRSPVDGQVIIQASLSDAHPECGNGAEWFVQHRTETQVIILAEGTFPLGGSAKMPDKTLSVRKGELISLILGPRDSNHSCDLTSVDLTITEAGAEKRVWNATKDLSGNILQGNPQADRYGHQDTWHLYGGKVSGARHVYPGQAAIPRDSLLGRWSRERDRSRKQSLADEISALAVGAAPAKKQESTPDGILYRQLHSLQIPWDDPDLLRDVEPDPRFGVHPLGHKVASNSMIVQTPSTIEFRIPADLAHRRTLVVVGTNDVQHGPEDAVQLQVSLAPPTLEVPLTNPIVCTEGTATHRNIQKALDEFRELFPIALCYTRIVPVDEVVTAILFHREDKPFRDLMLNALESVELDRLWDDLLYVSEEPLKLIVSLEQVREFSTQDRQELVEPFDRMKPVVQARADAFRKRLVETEPLHLQSVLDFADRAWRRRLLDSERHKLRELYHTLRREKLPHEPAIRLVLARVLTSPSFLYRNEKQPAGSQPAPVSDVELATRLSYFLWSSLPDDELIELAESNRLTGQVKGGGGEPHTEALTRQTRRMLADPRTRRLAVQFACQWLHVRDFDQTVEKNERLFPSFVAKRSDMYEETVRFFEDMFRNDGCVVDIIDCDHTFLNASLAEHYGIPDVTGSEWRRVTGVKSRGRGGLLGMAAVLASQSGASRTSPILRGNWVYETLLGERLPRPPASVPQLPDAVPNGLTSRELIARHSSAPECAKCHRRIDPLGFALEQFDAVGRMRATPVDTATTLEDGKAIEGLDGLRAHLTNDRRDDVMNQFCRKLLGYALGREVQLSDESLLAAMQEKLETNNYRFSVAVEAIVTSQQFRYARGAAQSP